MHMSLHRIHLSQGADYGKKFSLGLGFHEAVLWARRLRDKAAPAPPRFPL